MNIENLKTFITLADNCSFTQTAQKHAVVQSTVSSRIRELEKEIGRQLFIRDKSHVEITPAGTAFLDYAHRIIKLEEAAISEANLIGKFTGALTLGATHSLYDCYMAPYIKAFMKDHPDISLKVNIGHTKPLIADLNEGIVDIVFTYRQYNHPNYCSLPFKKDQIALVTASKNIQYQNGIMSNDAQNLPLLYSDYLYTISSNWILPNHYQYALAIDVGTKLITYLLDSEYYCFLPLKIAEEEIRKGRIIHIPILDIELPFMPSYILYREGSHKDKLIQDLIRLTRTADDQAAG